MKWGRKKASPSSSSSSSSRRFPSLSQVLPTSWLSRFKRMRVDAEPKRAKGKQNTVSSSPEKFAAGEGRFYGGGDGDAFWRLSFGEKSVDGKIGADPAGVLRSVWYDSVDVLGFPPSSCQRCGSNAVMTMKTGGIKRLGHMSWDVKNQDFRRDTEILPAVNVYKGERATVIKTPRLVSERDLKSRKRFEEAVEEKRLRLQRIKSEAEQKSKQSLGKFVSEVEAVRQIPVIGRKKLTGGRLGKHQNLSSINLRNCSLRTNDEERAFSAQKMEENKIEEPKVKSEKQRKSHHMSRESDRRRTKQTKVRVFSPRTPSKVETCKIKALEEMKKAKMKMKAAKQRRMKESTRLENFAVVKCSFDPGKDFRDSMIEMIVEKKISRPEELEELLACYLSLNSDEYHDLIIKAFRQVWFYLDQASFESFDIELQTEECSED
ncbi:hypothetical protein SLA2020_405460 [Shorea laevis]